MVSIRNPVAHGAAPDGLTIAALGLMDNLGLNGRRRIMLGAIALKVFAGLAVSLAIAFSAATRRT